MSYLAAIDEGTSSTRFIVTDRQGNVITSKQSEFTQHTPKSGYSEHDVTEIWNTTKKCIEEAMRDANLKPSDISALGITNQRETTVVWNKDTGEPYCNAIVWNDGRTADICDRLKHMDIENDGTGERAHYGHKGSMNRFKSITGLPISPYFSATKLIYLLENVPNLRKDAEEGTAIFGTIDTWLVYKLTGGKSHVTDVSNASRTLLMDLKSVSWSDILLRDLNIPKQMLPRIVPSGSTDIGHVEESAISALAGVPITGILGDQQAALFGQVCFNRKETKVTYGTGAFLLMNTGSDIIHSHHGLLSTVAYQLPNDSRPVYALEGGVAYAGATLQWCRNNMKLFHHYNEVDGLASKVPDNGDVYFVPAFSGLLAPHWRPDARGCIVGLSAFNTKEHIIRAALESIGFSVSDVIQAMHKDVDKFNASKGTEPNDGDHQHHHEHNHKEAQHNGEDHALYQQENADHCPNSSIVVKVDGGVTNSKVMMQFQADILNATLHIPTNLETTAVGALFIAGLASGYYKSIDELREIWKLRKEYCSKMDDDVRKEKLRKWHKAIEKSCGWL